jgi:glycine/D-amino acid oxidase-like deaminating enzyme
MTKTMLTRRRLLQTLGLAAASSEAGCATWFRSYGRYGRLNPVLVSNDREIRTVVGLRPFRASGFVVRAERMGDKVVVHNYGHGGAGITLSWGTSYLAVNEVLAAAPSPTTTKVAVLGCGAVGMATARLCQQHGYDVTIYARELPPETTSNIAGGQWFPGGLWDHNALTPAFLQQFDKAVHFSHRWYQTLSDRYGVHWLPNWILSDRPLNDTAMMGDHSPIHDLLPELKEVAAEDNPFHTQAARRLVTMHVDPPTYLAALLGDVREAGGRVVVTELRSLDDVKALSEPVVVNCTGLGAKALFGDDELQPVRGQLTILLPQPEVDYAVEYKDLYMFPRRDGVVLGGTYERGNWSLDVDLVTKQRIVEAHAQLFAPLI